MSALASPGRVRFSTEDIVSDDRPLRVSSTSSALRKSPRRSSLRKSPARGSSAAAASEASLYPTRPGSGGSAAQVRAHARQEAAHGSTARAPGGVAVGPSARTLDLINNFKSMRCVPIDGDRRHQGDR
jgi:hypothetical protein|eukprot:COSAG01_NODE_2151_length_8294_cov_12.317472_11_plen_128_part_00